MNINIIITRLEYGIDAVTTPNDDGTYTIAINNKLCEERAKKALLHEITHIKKTTFQSLKKRHYWSVCLGNPTISTKS